jgi:hypothetical protein
MTTLADVGAALAGAQHSVFRLEGRQLYPDDPAWVLHCAGEDWTADPDLDDWCALLDEVTSRATWQRVRIVVEPWTDYTRHEVEAQYPYSLRHGERIGLVHAFVPWDTPDYWLIDDREGWLLRYGPRGLTSVSRTANPDDLELMRDWRDRALRQAEWLPVPASV